jgi:alkanesulfonate monooxygenase SsuD/methylene tetrahydromethanopterin reductase-like flavin-dependent oxidoreductase (luciferase family)
LFGFIAARTQRVRLLALATAASYRPAGLLAKAVTTLDVLSGGRAMLGIGAGDYAEEAVGLGLPYPSLGERFELLETPSRRACGCGRVSTPPNARFTASTCGWSAR